MAHGLLSCDDHELDHTVSMTDAMKEKLQNLPLEKLQISPKSVIKQYMRNNSKASRRRISGKALDTYTTSNFGKIDETDSQSSADSERSENIQEKAKLSYESTDSFGVMIPVSTSTSTSVETVLEIPTLDPHSPSNRGTRKIPYIWQY